MDLNIYSCIDNKNIDKIIVLFNSVFENCSCKNNIKFYLIIDELPEIFPYIPEDISCRLTIRELKMSDKWKDTMKDFNEYFYLKANWCKCDMNFARFLVFNIFPELERVIYLDWDMIVLGNIYELIDNYKDKENFICSNLQNGQTMFNNIFVDEFRYSQTICGLRQIDKFLKIKNHRVTKIMNFLNFSYKDIFGTCGFNAGFYIVSKEHFEENYLLEFLGKLIIIQKKVSCFNFGTQIVLNLLHIDKRVQISKKWNHLPILDYLENDLKIIHWNGLNKPWVDKKDNLNKVWWDYYKKVY